MFTLFRCALAAKVCRGVIFLLQQGAIAITPAHTKLPAHLKLTVTCRIESGCLGPDGDALIDDFCLMAQIEFDQIRSHYINWIILPRPNKSIPEIQFQLLGKNLNVEQADQYLARFDESVEELENYISEVVAFSINLYRYENEAENNKRDQA